MADLQYVKGLSALSRTLKEFTPKLRKEALASATRAAAAPIRDQARVNAPVWHGDVSKGHPPPGTLKKNIIYKRIPEKCTQNKETWYVYVRRKGKDKPFYWWWVEFGSANNAPRFFMRNAFNQKVQEAISRFKDALGEGVQKITLRGNP